MITRAAPGEQLAQGRLRVDAARAIAKLREYQLVDRTTWVLEAVRAAIASGATHVEVAGDSNDVWLSWRGDAWPAGQLPRLFDELVSPEPAEEHHHLRLLATAINTALGLAPAFVDVIRIPATGDAERVRYQPDVLEAAPETSGDDSALRRLAVERVPRDQRLPLGPGMQIHYRRRLGLDVLKMFARLEWMPELRHVGEACRSVPVPLVLGESTFTRADLGNDLVRVPLGEPLAGFLAIVDPATLPARGALPMMEVAERGVVLARVPIDLGIGIGEATVPIRVFLDAPRLPTNASRSEVRRDAYPLPLAEERARERIPELLAALRAALDVDVVPRAIRDAVITLLAAECPDHEELHAQAGKLGGIGDVPLVLDACGVRRPIAQRWRAIVHTGRSAMPAELAPWFADVLWLPDDGGARRLVMGPIERRAFRQHVRWARRQAVARTWFYEHAPRALRVENVTPRVRARLGVPIDRSCVPDAAFAGLTGEVCLLDDESAHGEVVVLLEGRELDRIRMRSSIGFAAIVDDPRVTPGERYRSAVDDAALGRVRDAIRAGLVRAAEALALEIAGYLSPHGYEVAEDPAQGAALVRAASAVVDDLPDESPLAIAPVWPVRGGHLVTLAELRAAKVIAVASTKVYVPDGRPVVDAGVGSELIVRLCPSTLVVNYNQATEAKLAPPRAPARVTAGDLATELLTTCTHALAVRDPSTSLRAAIGLVELHDREQAILGHAGIAVLHWEATRTNPLFRSRIAIDCDDVVPSSAWDGVRDDVGLTKRHYDTWERQLAAALALALVGERSDDLLGPPLTFTSEATRVLLAALVKTGPVALLGSELARRLLDHPLLTLHGDPQLRSIDEMHALFPWGVNYVPEGLEPVPGYTPLVAGELVATAIAALAGRAAVDGVSELERRRREQAHAARLAALRARPVEPVVLPYETPRVDLVSPHARGEVGISSGGVELHVFVEGRRFAVVRRADELPLIAAVDIAADRASETLEALADATEEALITEIRALVPALVKHVMKSSPLLLGDPSRARTLLARWCADAGPNDKLRGKLRQVDCFRTIQGGRASAKDATSDGRLRVASWHGDWLAADGDPDPLDGPVLLVDDDELQQILSELARGHLEDVTEPANKLQATRQMARGLLPVPKLPVVAAVVRTFGELGVTGLGFGEIGLVDEDRSMVSLHARGVLRETVPIAVVPSVHVALEAPELLASEGGASLSELAVEAHPIARIVPQLWELTEKLLRDVTRTPLPPPILRRLRLAVLTRRLDGARVPDAALFTTIDGTATKWSTFEEQRELFGQVWVVPDATAHRPVDERRRVLVLAREEIRAAIEAKLPVVEAQRELALDEKSRVNRARAKATSLLIEPSRDFLAIVKLTGDGITTPRGYVAALAPEAAHRRMLRPHRDMHPFDNVADPCEWPTYAQIDDARLVPDRVWQAPEGGAIWSEVLSAVRVASAQALRDAVTLPAGALACERLTSLSHDGLASLKGNLKARIRGALWISGPPRAAPPPPPIHVVTSDGATAFPLERDQGLTGTLYVHAPDGFHAAALEELCANIHARLVRSLATNRALAGDLVTAHVAHAIAMRRVQPVDVRGVWLGCFTPDPLDPTSWLRLLEREERLRTVAPGTSTIGRAVVDDGSQLSRVVRDWLERRVTFEPAVAPPAATRKPPTQPPPSAASPVHDLAARLVARLAGLDVPRVTCRVVGRTEPMLSYKDARLELAGEHPQVMEIANALRLEVPWAITALDALAAHALTLLNVALSEVTDATELRALDGLLARS